MHGCSDRDIRTEFFAERLQTFRLQIPLGLDLQRNAPAIGLNKKIHLGLVLACSPVKRMEPCPGKYLLLNVLLTQYPLELLKYAVAVDNDSGTEIGLCCKQSDVNEKRLERIVFIRIKLDGRFRHPAYMRDEPGIKQPAHSGFEFSRALDFCAIFIANLNRLLQISSYSPKGMPRHNGCFSGKFSLSGNTPPFFCLFFGILVQIKIPIFFWRGEHHSMQVFRGNCRRIQFRS